jgi:hypothetical protein
MSKVHPVQEATRGKRTPSESLVRLGAVRRLAGWTGLTSVVLWLAQFQLYMQGDPSVSVCDGDALVAEMFRIHDLVFARILLNLAAYVTAMIFAALLSQLIQSADPERGWLGTLVFGAMAVWMGVTLVANGLEGGAALDTLAGNGDPAVVRALTMGSLLIYNGAIAFALTGLFLGAAGYATLATGLLPRWTGWLAITGAALCALSVPAMFAGAADIHGFYNTGGWGLVVIANFPPGLSFIAARIALLTGRRSGRLVGDGHRQRELPAR